MNEWFDVIAYSIQAVMLWVAMPRWLGRFVRPMLTDRNPDWVASNPDIIGQFERGSWWYRALRTWGLLTVFMLVMFRLELQPASLATLIARQPLWQVLMTTSNLMLAAGLLLSGYGVVSFLRWQNREIPPGEPRQALLVPRTTDDYVPRRVQYLIYGMMAANLLARPVAGLFWPERIPDVWGNFAMGLVISVVLFLVGVGSVARAENHMDRILGPSYRRMEVRVAFGLMACVVAVGATALVLEITGLDSRRYGAVMIALYVSAALGLCMSLPTTPPKDVPGPGRAEQPGRS